jgi:chorismate-pyruvate lyase
LNLIYPLDTFYRKWGLAVPEVEAVEGDAVPSPYNELLVHANDMTPTLEAFHRSPIELRLIQRHLEGDLYSRLVDLSIVGHDSPVEFGCIAINLQHFPAAAREVILDGHMPLGTILSRHKIEHQSCPLAYVRVKADPFMSDALYLTGSPDLYGRRNVLYSRDRSVLAEVLEILPPIG